MSETPASREGAARRLPVWAILAVLVIACCVPAVARATDPLADIDAVIDSVMRDWQVTGLAVGVVRPESVLLARGYGYRDEARTAPVTAETLFATGSVTKSFTATAIAMLADEGALDWDQPLTRTLPTFRPGLQPADEPVSLRHAMTHLSGVPRNDVLWYVEIFDRADIINRLQFVEVGVQPGTVFAYSNIMVMVAGEAAARAVGQSWESLIESRVLHPLGMTSTRLTLRDFLISPNWAAPYYLTDTTRIPIAFLDPAPIAPAAAVYANVNDLGRYLRFHLNRGALDGTRLLSRDAAEALATPQVAVDKGGFEGDAEAEVGPRAYGLGFYIREYRGERMVYHLGAIDGYRALLSFMPELGYGVVVLSNVSGRNRAPDVIARAIYDRLLALPPIDWNGRFARWRDQSVEGGIAHRARRERVREEATPPLPPTHPRQAFAGTYVHPAYGTLTIQAAADDTALAGSFNGKPFRLAHGSGDSWEVTDETVWPVREGLRMTFYDNGTGTLDRLATAIADGPTYRLNVGDVVFVRASAPAGEAAAAGLGVAVIEAKPR